MKLKNAIMRKWCELKQQKNKFSLNKILWVMKARVKGKREDDYVEFFKNLRRIKS